MIIITHLTEEVGNFGTAKVLHIMELKQKHYQIDSQREFVFLR